MNWKNDLLTKNETVIIDYDIFCFDRISKFQVLKRDHDKALKILDLAYSSWNEDDQGFCLEEYMETCVREAGCHCRLMDTDDDNLDDRFS